MTYLDFLEQKVLLERLVIGLEEPVLIKGLGELSAKIDSGNGGYNVIHGTDFHQQGNELMFTTHDSFGHEKKIQAKVIDTIEVNMGGGNIENRPVIELDIKFAGEDYKKIPFSVSDRSSNTNPILISKGFVENELEALIDVGKKNISNDGIDVVYGEGIGGFLKGATKMAGKGLMGAVNTAASGVKNLGNYLKGGQNANLFSPITGAAKIGGNLVKGAVGAGAGILGVLALPAMGTIWSFSKLLKMLDNVVKEDQQAIRKKLPNSILPKKITNDKSATVEKTIWKDYNKVNFPKLEVFPIVSFKARVGDIFKGDVVTGMEARVKNWKSQLKKASAACKKGMEAAQQKQAKGQTQQQQENLFDESINLFNDASLLLEFNELSSMGASTGQANMGQPQNQTQDQQQDLNPNQDVQLNDEEIQETATQFQELNNFILYFIPSSADNNGQQIGGESKKKVLELFQSKKFDNLLLKFFNVGKVTPDSTRKIVEAIASNLRDFCKNFAGGLYQGSFALVTGEMNKREVHLFDNVAEAVWIDDTKKASDTKQANENLNKVENVLNTKFPDLKNQVQNLDVSIFSDNREAQSLLSPQGKKIVNKYNTTLARAEKGASKGVRIQQETLDAILQPLTNGEGQTAIIKLTLGKDEVGQQILSLLGNNFKTTGWDDFVSKCAKNEKVLELLSDENLDTTPVNNQDETQEVQDDDTPPTTTDDRTPRFNDMEQKIGKSIDTPPSPTPENTPPPSDEVPPTAQPTDDVPQQPEVKSKVQDVPTTKTSEKINTENPKQNNDIRVKSRAQMNAHARQNKKHQMKKGKKKGTESEEEPWIEEEEDLWIKSKLQHFRNKGIM